jgi:hypothetical protein
VKWIDLPAEPRILVVALRRLGSYRQCLDELLPEQVFAAVDQALRKF